MRGLICDDHPLVRQAIIMAMQSRWPDLSLSGASNFPDAFALAEQAPDLIVVDLAMPGSAPVEGLARLRATAPAATLVVLTGLTDRALLADVETVAVAAILPKTLEGEALLDRIGELMPALGETRSSDLPRRQQEVLRLLGEGLTNKEIALRLGIAPATVKVHVSRLIEQLGAANRTDAVSKGQRAGLI